MVLTRVILNLKVLNCEIEKHHFKMETLKSALQCISKHSWFGSVDLKDAYYSIQVNKFDRKYLRCYWNVHLYEYTCLPNGLTTAPRIFTKILYRFLICVKEATQMWLTLMIAYLLVFLIQNVV
jgi:hypothetical protein